MPSIIECGGRGKSRKGAEKDSRRPIMKSYELNEVQQDLKDKSDELDEVQLVLVNKKNEVWEQEQQLEIIREDADEAMQKAKLAENLIEYYKGTNSGEREKAYFEKMLDLKYENECLKRENQELKAENRSLKAKLEKVYDFMRQFTINGMNMLGHFLRNVGE